MNRNSRILLQYFLLFSIACAAPASAQVLPTAISDLRLWLDASDVNNTGTNAPDGTSVTTWSDRSGLNNHATVFGVQNAGVLTHNQINGKPVIHFTRVSQTLGSVYQVAGVDIRATAMPNVTIFTVYRQGNQSGDQAVWGNDNGAWDRFFFSSWTSQVGANNGGVSRGTNAVTVNNAGLVGTTRLLTTVYQHNVAGGSSVYFDGQVVQTVQDITSAADAQTTLRIGFDGDDNCFNGDIAEMIVYNRKLDACEIQQINRYLGAKYGITFSTVAINTPATSFYIGGSTTLTSSVSGTAYQWLRNGAVIPSATGNSYVATTGGSYRLAVTANGCTDTSAAVAISANHMPPPGNGLRFDGSDDYVDCGTPAALAATNIKTMECWVRFNSFANDQEILSKSIVSNGIELLTYGSNLAFFVMNSGTGSASHVDYPLSNLQTGVWYHLAASWDGVTKESMRLYVNGQPAGNRSDGGNLNSGGVDNPAASFKIGSWSQAGTPRYFNGSIDEVRIWSTQRSGEQLLAANRDTIAGNTSGLIACYRFDHGTANGANAGVTTLYNFTGTGNNGTLTNFALNGTNSNWVESYAMVIPTPNPASTNTGTSFRANWTAPAAGTVNNYYLTVAIDSNFTSPLAGYNNVNVGTATFYDVTGLTNHTQYYYRVRANKTSVANQALSWGFTPVLTTDPLPVQWIEFNAARNGDAVCLRWACHSEEEIRAFEAQRSNDGLNFSTLSRLEPAGAAAGGTFEAWDREPQKGRQYYRIKVVNSNGDVYFSALRSLQAAGTGAVVTVGPVPSGSFVTLHHTDVQLAGTDAFITDATGRRIAALTLDGADQRIDMRNWLPGIYFLHLANGQVLRLIRN